MVTRRVPGRFLVAFVPLVVTFGLSSCTHGQRATDVGDPGFPFGPTSVGAQTLSYAQDIKPILDRDCLSCHSNRDARGGYSVSRGVRKLRRGRIFENRWVDAIGGGSWPCTSTHQIAMIPRS
jgi:hypothetical protein